MGWSSDGEGWEPFPGVEVELRRDGLWARSPYLALGPLDPASTRGAARTDGGWAGVGDHAVQVHGRYRVTGRGSAAVTTGGHTVVVEHVEQVLRSVPGVHDAAGRRPPAPRPRRGGVRPGRRPRRGGRPAGRPRPGGSAVAPAPLGARRRAAPHGRRASPIAPPPARAWPTARSPPAPCADRLLRWRRHAPVPSPAAPPPRSTRARPSSSPPAARPSAPPGTRCAARTVVDLAAAGPARPARRRPRARRRRGRSTRSCSATAGARAATPPGSRRWPPGSASRCPGVTVDRQCGSGPEAVHAGAAAVAGRARGAGARRRRREREHRARPARWPDGSRATPARRSPRAGLGDPDMGPAAEAVAARCGVSRERQDAYAAALAPARPPAPRTTGSSTPSWSRSAALDPRRAAPAAAATAARLARLRPAFAADGTVTAGNSCGINDGAAAVALVPEAARAALGVPGLASAAWAARGVDPGAARPRARCRRSVRCSGAPALALDDVGGDRGHRGVRRRRCSPASTPSACDDDERVNARGRRDRARPPVGRLRRAARRAAVRPARAIRRRRPARSGWPPARSAAARAWRCSWSGSDDPAPRRRRPLRRPVGAARRRPELAEPRIGRASAPTAPGKSTLARLLNGLVAPDRGHASRSTASTPAATAAAVRRRVGLRLHRPGRPDRDAHRRRGRRVLAAPAAAAARRGRRAGRARRCDRFGLDGHADHPAHLLSGGQKQLLALASVLVTEPDVLVCDEPTTLLDLRNARRVGELLAGLPQQVVLVTHDLDLVDGFDRVLVVDDGRVVADGPPQASVARYRDLVARVRPAGAFRPGASVLHRAPCRYQARRPRRADHRRRRRPHAGGGGGRCGGRARAVRAGALVAAGGARAGAPAAGGSCCCWCRSSCSPPAGGRPSSSSAPSWWPSPPRAWSR